MELAGKNVLVTGGAGFIGSHLVKHLVNNKIKVVVPYVEIDKRSYFHEQGLHRKTRFIYCDLRDFEKTFRLIKNNKVDFVFHLAAQAIVDAALKNPLATFQSNVMGTVNILEAARNYGKVRGIIVTSSDKAYGKIPRAVETDPVSGDHPYETSKASADLIARGYWKTYGLPVVVTRFGNVYGEGDLNFSRIIPGIMRSLIRSEQLLIRSNGKYVRDYVYVGDVIRALIVLAKNLGKIGGQAFNISANENLDVLELINKIEKILDKKIKYKITNTVINEIPTQSLDFRKIKRHLGWQPSLDLRRTTAGIYEWYLSYFKNQDLN